MTIYLATKTLQAIDAALEKDQGNAYRALLGKVLPHMNDAYRSDESGHRGHLGASIVGNECARQIWYSFRWAKKSIFDGKTLRLFNRGHLEEGRFIALLLMIGVQVYQQDENGNQFRIHHAEGHMGGSGDGWGLGIPDLTPDTRCLLEYKTHGEKSFIKLAGAAKKDRRTNKRIFVGGLGLQKAKPEHYVQMVLYMKKMGFGAGLYAAVNKNTDDIYLELIAADDATADQFFKRGELIVAAEIPPKRISNSPGFFGCMFCDFKGLCHFKESMETNCRTCKYSAPIANSTWYCRLLQKELTKEDQLAGCEKHEQITNT